MDTLFKNIPEWSREDTQRYLTANPLPSDFTWKHRDDLRGQRRPVVPSYRIRGGFGKWLRETPYFPGLFELVHEILFHAPYLLPTPELVARLEEVKRAEDAQTELPL
jgi:hypothetical protein